MQDADLQALIGTALSPLLMTKGQSHRNVDALSRRPVESQVTPRLTDQLLKHTVTHPLCNAVETRSSKSRPSTNTSIPNDTRRQPAPYHLCKFLDSDVDVQHEQQLDQNISTVIVCVKNGEQPAIRQIRRHNPGIRRLLWQYPKFILQDGILYRKKKDKLGNLSLQLVVPTHSSQGYSRNYGDPWSSGHFGAHRTMQRAESMCYWPFMNREIIDLCNICTACESFRLPTPKHQAPLCPTTRHLEMVLCRHCLASNYKTRTSLHTPCDRLFQQICQYLPKERSDCSNYRQTSVWRIFERTWYFRDFVHGPRSTVLIEISPKTMQQIGYQKSRSMSPYHPQGAGIV